MLLILSLFACKPEAAAPVASASTGLYELSPVEAAKYRPEIELTGSLTPVASVQLGFMVGGRLEALLVNRGQMVAENQAIARLDSALASAQLAAAEAAVKGAAAQLAAGESGLARAKSLHDALGMSDQQFQDASAGVEAGRAGVDQALASARLARANFGFHTLKSPINGVVSSAPDNPGAVVGPGSPLFVIEDLSALMLKATAPETAIWLKEGLEATIVSGSGLRAPAKVARVLPALPPTCAPTASPAPRCAPTATPTPTACRPWRSWRAPTSWCSPSPAALPTRRHPPACPSPSFTRKATARS